jgi:hypothetical protein
MKSLLREFIELYLIETGGAPMNLRARFSVVNDKSGRGHLEPIKKNDVDSTEGIASHLIEPEVAPEDCFGPVPPTSEDPHVISDPYNRAWI